MYDAINKGIGKATGSLLGYLNCDEQYLPGALSKIAEIFDANHKIQIVSGGVLVLDEFGGLISKRPGIRPWLWHVQIDHLPTFTAGLFWRHSVTEPSWAKFDTRMKACADATWFIDRLKDGTDIRTTKFFLSVFSDTGENLNLKPEARAEGQFLKSTAPMVARVLQKFIVAAHRFRKLIMGCYFPTTVRYSIYTKNHPSKRTMFEKRCDWGIWWNRLKF